MKTDAPIPAQIAALVAFTFATLVAVELSVGPYGCHRPAPQTTRADAGTTDAGAHAAAPKLPGSMVVEGDAVAPVGGVQARVDARKKWMAAHPPPNIAAPKPEPGDPRVIACQAQTTKQGLLDCLEPLKTAPKLAPGKLGSVRPPIRCPAQAVTDWYFSSTGNDENSCTTSGSPCTNVNGPQEVEARWGCGGSPERAPLITATTKWHMPAGGMSSASHFEINPTIVGNGSFEIVIDSPTVSTSGTISGLIAQNRLAGQPLTINLTGAASYLGQRIINSSRGNSMASIDAALSTNVARLTQPIDPTTYQEVNTWANGNSYAVQQPGTVYLDAFRPTCSVVQVLFAEPAQPCAARAVLRNVNLPSIALGSVTYATSQLKEVSLINSTVAGLINARYVWFINDFVSQTPENIYNSLLVGGSFVSAFYNGVEDEQYNTWVSGTYLHGFAIFPPLSIIGYDSFWVDPAAELVAQGQLYAGAAFTGSTTPFGIYNLNPAGGATQIFVQFPGSLLTYNGGSAVNSFSPGLTLTTDMGAFAYAVNAAEGHDMLRGPRPLTPTLLDTPVLSGGFGGVALNGSLSGAYYNWSFALPPAIPFTAQPFTEISCLEEIAGDVLHMRSDFAKTASGNLVMLRDESGANNDFNVLGGAAIPFASPPWIHFSTGEIASNSLGLGDHSTMIVVMKSSGAYLPSTGTIWDNGNLQILDNVPTATHHWGTYLAPYLDSGHNVDDGLPHILVMRSHTASNVDLITDGALANFTTGTAYQSRSNNLNDGLTWDGYIAETGAFNTDLSDQAIDHIDHCLSGRYGVPIVDIAPTCQPLIGDTTGTTCANTNVAVQNEPWSSGAPTVGQVPEWTVQSPSSIPGLVTWVDSDVGITTVSSNVSAWLDQSSNAYNFVQATGGNRPAYTASGGLNGHGYLTYTAGSNQALLATVASLSTPFEAVAVTDRTGNGYLFDYGSNDHTCFITGGTYGCYPTGPYWGAVSTGAHAYDVNWQFPAGVEYVDGTSAPINNLSGSATGTALTIGNYGGGGNGFGGRYYALFVYNHALTTAQRNALGGYINNRWGITIAGSTSPTAWVPTTSPWCPINLATCTTGALPYSSLSGAPVSSSLTYEGQAVQIAAAGSGNGKLLWPAALAAPTLSQSAPTSDVATSVTNILGQPAFSGATGTNRNGGSIYIGGGNSAAGGANGPALFGSGAATYAFTSNTNAAFGIGNTPGTDPTITRGTGVPATTQPNGSLFLRTDGSGGSDALYARESSTWYSVGGTSATVSAGTGISVSGGPAYTVSNTGVTSITASTGISASTSTGPVTLTNTGVTSLTAGTDITLSGSTGGVTVAVTNPPALGYNATGVTLSGSATGTFASVIGTSMTVPASANVAVKASISCQDNTGGDTFEWAIGVDGSVVPYAAQHGYCTLPVASAPYCGGSIDMVVSGLSTGSHTFDLIQAIVGAVLPVAGAGCVGDILVTAN